MVFENVIGIDSMDDALRWRENIEWQNIWWEQANNTEVKRIALLGDSVTRGYRSKLSELTAEKYAVDLCASSSQITDPLLWREYKFFLDCGEWKYSQVFLQTGGQHGHIRRCCDDNEYFVLFKKNYGRLVEKIIPYCSDILIVSSTPCRRKENLNKWDDYRNEELKRRNDINMWIADEFCLPYIDIWTPLIEARYEYSDYIHMKAEGNSFIAGYLGKILL